MNCDDLECFHPDHFAIWRPELFVKIRPVWPAPIGQPFALQLKNGSYAIHHKAGSYIGQASAAFAGRVILQILRDRS